MFGARSKPQYNEVSRTRLAGWAGNGGVRKPGFHHFKSVRAELFTVKSPPLRVLIHENHAPHKQTQKTKNTNQNNPKTKKTKTKKKNTPKNKQTNNKNHLTSVG